MKKILITTIITALTIGVISAQNVTFGARAGVNMSTMMPAGETTPLNDGFGMRTASNFGLFTELHVNPTFSLRVGVEYSALGGRRDGMQAMPTQRLVNDLVGGLGMVGMLLPPDIMAGVMGTLGAWSAQNPYYYVNVENTVKFDFVTIPVLAQFGTNLGDSPWRIHANVGPVLSFILSGSEVASGTSARFSDATGTTTLWDALPQEIQDIASLLPPAIAPDLEAMFGGEVTFGTTETTGEMRSVNLGVAANLGLSFQHNRHRFFLEVGGSYGFFTVQNADNGNRLAGLTVSLGYAVSLW